MTHYVLTNNKMSPRVEYAYNAWKNQRRRCSGKTSDPTYHGLSVEYTSRELVDWFLERTTDNDYKYIVGRIDHNKGYSLDNIRLETRRESSIEMIDRLNKRKPLIICDKKTHEELMIAKDSLEAAYLTGINQSAVVLSLKRYEKKTPFRNRGSGYYFKYLKEN